MTILGNPRHDGYKHICLPTERIEEDHDNECHVISIGGKISGVLKNQS
eukprot:CAMPEP_0118717618 /NCGR_PEP_ID=MMETSP0800-20121206/28274_1 /TAXON_ID=210618 ORGANISM="Striatella unipunctata, Strain CCMP2910" /NCGR_SAMPLE_ID=MMETSP0800 /ASSEMBLY_ACC=CAM_ASM_000638 /LENGTH=47 /DNA_ID= /DNA_START= /DNA_END= /DNA_ORIENTATION=